MRQQNLFLFLAITLIFSPSAEVSQAFAADMREPAVSGRFYPSDPEKLSLAVRHFLDDALPAKGERPIAIAAPHAGYIYSGQICADAFAQAAGHEYDLIVLLGTNHSAPGFRGISVYSAGGYRTPLGVAEIDEKAAAALMSGKGDISFHRAAHEKEHSVEVMIPFVQTLFPGVKILPAIVAADDPEVCARFGRKLAEVIRTRRALLVSSTDLSHYPAYEDAAVTDRNTLEAMISLDPARLNQVIRTQERKGISNLSTCACGQAPIMAVMTAAKALGANCGRIISYANSGDASVGTRDRVVGYGAVVFAASESCTDRIPEPFVPESESPADLNDAQKKSLLVFARNTITWYLDSETVPLARGFDAQLWYKQGAFVTLKKQGNLRGCIGHMAEDRPLCQVVGEMALNAAFEDRRFRPLAAAELPQCEIEISVLTPFREVSGPEQILVGRDGVLIRKDGRSAVFLPQVAPEQGWNREQMLEHLCQKAGLASDAWKENARFFTFQANVFSEHEFK
ncbi:MAG: AmmeMemoRadiSam system protein B [Desulfobacterales bacterium]